ncbi:MAG: sugar phosphate isomerase/epimerase [Lachnospiraceae bacterium]|nr:sugar phosphate isomerase/epimerase [Lachnospiraceae bacterium]
MKIGVSSYSYSQYLKSGRLDLISVIRKAADMGFEAIEYTDLPKDEPENRIALAKQIKAEAAICGLELSAYVVGGNLLCETDEAQRVEIERLKGELDIAKVLGVKLFRYDVVRRLPLRRSFESVLEGVVPAMRQIADYGQSLGIMTMIENHGYAFQDYDRVEKIYHAVNHENFGLLLDIGNFLCADQDNVMCVSRLAHLACHVHLKDFDILDYYSGESAENCFKTRACNLLRGTAVGHGAAKTAQCLSILKEVGYDGYVDIEFEGPEDCVDELERGLAFCREFFRAEPGENSKL